MQENQHHLQIFAILWYPISDLFFVAIWRVEIIHSFNHLFNHGNDFPYFQGLNRKCLQSNDTVCLQRVS